MNKKISLVPITDIEELGKLERGTVILDWKTFYRKSWEGGWQTFNNPYRYSSTAFALPVHVVKVED